MFYIKGWLPLADFTRRSFALHRMLVPEWEQDVSSELLSSIIGAESCGAVWEFLLGAHQVGVVTANAKIVFAGEKLLSPGSDPLSGQGDCVDIFVGTVGSASWEDEDGATGNIENKKEKYGPFLYCPIVVRLNEAEKYLKKIAESHPDKHDHSITAAIISAHDANPQLTKPELRKQICPDLKLASFEAHFKEAAEARPRLSIRGPRLREINGAN